MCLPSKSDQSQSATSARSLLGLGAVMLLACLVGPALAGAAGVALLVVLLCLVAPAAMGAWQRRSRVPMSANAPTDR